MPYRVSNTKIKAPILTKRVTSEMFSMFSVFFKIDNLESTGNLEEDLA